MTSAARATPAAPQVAVPRPVVGWLAQQLGTVFIQREKRSDAKRWAADASSR